MQNPLGTCRRHLTAVDETYTQHLFFAIRTGVAMIAAGGACIIHGCIPFLFERTGSRTIKRLAAQIQARSANPGAGVSEAKPSSRYLGLAAKPTPSWY